MNGFSILKQVVISLIGRTNRAWIIAVYILELLTFINVGLEFIYSSILYLTSTAQGKIKVVIKIPLKIAILLLFDLSPNHHFNISVTWWQGKHWVIKSHHFILRNNLLWADNDTRSYHWICFCLPPSTEFVMMLSARWLMEEDGAYMQHWIYEQWIISQTKLHCDVSWSVTVIFLHFLWHKVFELTDCKTTGVKEFCVYIHNKSGGIMKRLSTRKT